MGGHLEYLPRKRGVGGEPGEREEGPGHRERVSRGQAQF